MMYDEDENDDDVSMAQASPKQEDTGESADDFLNDSGISIERRVPDITKPWMKHHKFELVKSIAQLNEIVDEAIKRKECALDLETEGLDNRIFYREDGSPYTKHNIVGYCLSYDGITGFYAPVGHALTEGRNPNLPLTEANAAITRLCLASQPKVSPEGLAKDPLSSREWLEPPQMVLFFWHAKFDQEFLYPVTGIDWWHPDSFEDGNLAFFCHYSADKNLSLKDKAFQLLRDVEGNAYEMIKLKELFISGRRKIQFDLLDPEEPGATKYAGSDAICTFLLCTKPRVHEKERIVDVMKLAKERYGFTYRLEKQTCATGRWMERPRVRVNRDKAEVLRAENVIERNELEAKIVAVAAAKGFHGFLPGSTKQLNDFLFTSEGLDITLPILDNVDFPGGKPPLNEKSGQHKTDADTLERLLDEHPNPPDILQWVVDWRKLEKLDTTYLQPMVSNIDERGEMRFQFKQTGAGTGRFSAPGGQPDQGYSGIPIHGIPATSAIREAFESRDGYSFAKLDYAGQELRVVANVSGEMVWIKEFLEGSGDLHTITARAFFGKHDVSAEERKKGKVANFALVYGGGPQAIMRATGCDKVEASRRKKAFDEAVPTFAKWVKGQHKKVKEENGIWNPYCRWIAAPAPKQGLPPDEIRRQEAARQRFSGNAPIQSSGADIMKISLVLLFKDLWKRGWLKQNNGDDSVRILLTVHDELVFEIKNERVQEALPVLKRIMESPATMTSRAHSPPWRVPLIVEPLIGQNWNGKYDYGMLTHGKPYKEGDKLSDKDIVVDDHVYHKVPAWLEGHFIPAYLGGTIPAANDNQSVVVALPSPELEGPPAPVVQPPHLALVPTPPPQPPKTSLDLAHDVPFTVKISVLTKRTVEQVREKIASAFDAEEGQILCVQYAITGAELVDPALGIRVNRDKFVRALADIHISDGLVYPYVRKAASS